MGARRRPRAGRARAAGADHPLRLGRPWRRRARQRHVHLELEARRAGSDPTAKPIHLDMTFAEEGGEGATPYEVLLHAAMTGETTRFTRQDAVEQQWRIMQPLL